MIKFHKKRIVRFGLKLRDLKHKLETLKLMMDKERVWVRKEMNNINIEQCSINY